MIGTMANAAMIAAGGCVGLAVKKGLRPALEQAIHQATGALSSSGELMLVFSLMLGVLAGESLGIEEHLNRLGGFVENRLHLSGFAQSFVNGTLIYCVGAMAIVGSINDGLLGDPSTLITKGVIDGVTSIVLAATMGPGVIFSALPVIAYQGSITLFAGLLEPVLKGELLHQICAAGFVLVSCIGVNFMSDRFHIKVANFLPALLVPAAWAICKVLLARAGLVL